MEEDTKETLFGDAPAVRPKEHFETSASPVPPKSLGVIRYLVFGFSAISLIALGFLLNDYMRLRDEEAERVKSTASVVQPAATNAATSTEPDPLDATSGLASATIQHELTQEPATTPPRPEVGEFNTGFADHPAQAYNGPVRALSLSTAQRTFRTRLGQAYGAPINFGGSLTITRIGCGTGCSFAYALDKSSGRVFEFPLGGESNPYMWLRFQPDSALIWATWEDGYPADCKAQPWKLGAQGFTPLDEASSIECDVARNTI